MASLKNGSVLADAHALDPAVLLCGAFDCGAGNVGALLPQRARTSSLLEGLCTHAAASLNAGLGAGLAPQMRMADSARGGQMAVAAASAAARSGAVLPPPTTAGLPPNLHTSAMAQALAARDAACHPFSAYSGVGGVGVGGGGGGSGGHSATGGPHSLYSSSPSAYGGAGGAYTCMHTRMHIRMYTRMHTRMHTRIHAHAYRCALPLRQLVISLWRR